MSPKDTTQVRAIIMRRLLTPAQLEECFAAYEQGKEQGKRLSMVEIAIEKGYLRVDQSNELDRQWAEIEAIRDLQRSQPIAGYELRSFLGRGSTAVVFAAVRKATGDLVALKILAPSLSQDSKYVAHFLREVQSAGRLRHPNVVQVLDAGRSGPYHYYAMEYVPGRTVKALLDERSPLPEDRVIAIGLGVARALEAAEAAGLVHGDIKPSNLLMADDGAVKLADFGLAAEAGAPVAGMPPLPSGTPYYMSPEQVRVRPGMDIRSDIYSLGATLYQLSTGRPPFEGDNTADILFQQVYSLPVPPHQRNPSVSADLSTQIMTMLAKEPERRFQHARESVDALERLRARAVAPPAAGSAKAASQAAPTPAAAGPSTLWQPWSLAFLGLCMLAGGAVAYVVVRVFFR